MLVMLFNSCWSEQEKFRGVVYIYFVCCSVVHKA
jgi:hypothetical protein